MWITAKIEILLKKEIKHVIRIKSDCNYIDVLWHADFSKCAENLFVGNAFLCYFPLRHERNTHEILKVVLALDSKALCVIQVSVYNETYILPLA